MTPTEQFCRLLRERSSDHLEAGKLVYSSHLYGQVLSILRQELDSMVRAIFLLNQDLPTRRHFIAQTLQNTKWSMPNTRIQITDRHMVDLANGLFGWTNSVYRLGCAFIHLSPMANYRNENPFQQLTPDEVNNIKHHLNDYHGFPLTDDLNLATVSPYLLKVLDKVSSNLECYIADLEADKIGNL